ncbi:MAG: AAA family ATPase [Saprospiraceae bacterium]
MPFFNPAPFHAFKLKISDNVYVWKPLRDFNAVQFNGNLGNLAQRFKIAFEEKVIFPGKPEKVLDLLEPRKFEKKIFSLDFPASKNELAFPDFNLEFDVFISEQEDHFYCVVPALDLELIVHSREEMEDNITTAIEEEFLRKKRAQNVQDIISTIWYEDIQLETSEMSLLFHKPREKEEVKFKKAESLLDQVASRLPDMGPKVAFFRENEIAELAKILKGKFLKNILLVGPSGVGKSALVEEMARDPRKWDIGKTIWSTTASTLIKELTKETGWQDNLVSLVGELTKRSDVLFVKSLPELFEVGQYEGNEVSMADYFQNFLSRGEVIMISECTEEEFSKIELKNPNYLSLFNIIKVREPENMEAAIREKVRQMAHLEDLSLSDEVVKEVIRVFRRFNPYSGFPGKPIRFLESVLLNHSDSLKKSGTISFDHIYRYFCEETGMPRFMVDPDIPMNPDESLQFFESRVFGQPQALKQVVNVLSTVKTALTKTNKPIASFLMVGPTGGGKTELAKNLAEFMFGSKEKMVRLDMSEYSDAFGVMRLTGAGFAGDGVLTSAIRREPFAVLLFDEIEKAHPNFFDLLLQILSEGRLTDNKGKLVNFCSTVIMMTSNIGAGKLPGQQIGLNRSTSSVELSQHFTGAVEKFFKPELFNRIDLLVPFQPLNLEVIKKVVGKTLLEIRKREGLRSRPVHLDISPEVESWLAEKGYVPEFGARQLHRTIRESLLLPIANILNETPVEDKIEIIVSVKRDDLHFDFSVDPTGTDVLLEVYEQYALTDMASELRKEFDEFKEGTLFQDLESEAIMLRNTLAAMDGTQNLVEKVEQLSHMETLLDNAQFLEKSIHKLEIDFSIDCIEGNPFNPDWERQLEDKKASLLDLKIEFIGYRKKGFNTGWIYIFSPEPQQVAQFYEELMELSGMNVRNRFSIWHTRSEKIRKKLREMEDSYFLKEERTPMGGNLDFKEEEAMLCGMILQAEGVGTYTYFKPEAGLQVWQNGKGDDFPARIYVHENYTKKIPGTPHRKEFYKSDVPRRVFKNNTIKDGNFRINRETNWEGLKNLVKNQLDELFLHWVSEESR